MPTHPNNPSRTKSDYSSLTFFIQLLEEMQRPGDYNFLFKLHPMLAVRNDLRDELLDICKHKAIPVPYEFLRQTISP